MSPQPEFGRGLSARAATWLLFGALCAGVPAPAYLFVVLIAPLWTHVVVMLKAADAATVGVIGVQVLVQGAVFYGCSRIVVWGLRRLPGKARSPVLAGLCVASLAPLCFRAYAICYDHCSHKSVLGLLQEFSMS